MEQLKYVLYSVLILVGAALTYGIMKPVVQSQWILSKHQEEKITEGATCGYKEVSVKNTAGKKLFAANCAACHSIPKVLTGPALADVETRGPWTKRENLVKWVKSPARFIATNPYAKELLAQFNGQLMPSFTQLNDQQINQIFDYIKEGSSLMQKDMTAVP